MSKMLEKRIYSLKVSRIYGIIVFVTSKKRRVNFILNSKIKYYTKDMIEFIKLVAIALFIMTIILLFRFNIVCEVTVDGKKVGYVADKNEFETKVDEIINKEEEAKLYTIIEDMPEYELTLLEKENKTNEETILAKLEEDSETTYKLYAVTLEGKEEAVLASLDEAEEIVDEMTEKYEDDIDIEIGITDIITTDKKDETTVKVAKKNIKNEIEDAIEQKEKEEQEIRERESHTVRGVYLEVTPVSGIITSRYGNRESIRSSGHTGLDIAAPSGTPIKAAAGGTVTFAGYSGGYGYVVKMSHGNGIETYYGHCSKLYVSAGQKVEAGDTIAAVGSTGNSTGNHLHFEVRVNGNEVNPQNYLYK